MSFRNISSQQDFRVLRPRAAKSSDEKDWHDIYPSQVGAFFGRVRDFAVANWIPVVVGITSAIAGAVAGFYIGEKYSTANVAKNIAYKIKSKLMT